MRKVLIIDDEPEVAAFMAALVETELGFAPVVACSEETALDSISSFDYDLIISDTLSFRPHLPTERGGDRWQWLDLLSKQLRMRHSNVPVLMMTSYPREVYSTYAAHGLLGVIRKPFDIQETIKAILEAIMAHPDFNQRDHQFRFTSIFARKEAVRLHLDQNFFSPLAF
ncbi:MAG: response regulator [Chloroflexi bacterium]|nr:response regulator [Chloroflexota bacterium]